MSGAVDQRVAPGHATFGRFAYPPNELGYCGPAGVAVPDLAAHAREFDGAWPYLTAIADAAGIADPLDEEVVSAYWIGGPLLDRVDPGVLLAGLRHAFRGQVTGLLADLPDTADVLAHHSLHVLAVYPWVRFLDRDAGTPVRVMQSCRIRWGTVESVTGEDAVITSRPLTFEADRLRLGDPRAERVRWHRNGTSLTAAPAPGDAVAAHWDWICGTLTAEQTAALDAATRSTLAVVNTTRSSMPPQRGDREEKS
ncbi:hypothetical protein H7I41_04475 [Mycobacterium manitobense]|uniref:Uncharacterized protein n=1 Tax=[Mycobacterium] manitobense TaxID=190147 RepID=A0A9X2YK26_9MYCO|nr:DUF6390 family protein [[Mycobacterium] manitobense]MCV7169179.1 hypothetical protein [[Mycobacterium] manitobense]